MIELNYKRGINIACALAQTNAKELAKKIGIPRVTMYSYTSDTPKRMSLATAVAIADACDITVEEFVHHMREVENA